MDNFQARPNRPALSYINQPIRFSFGQFAGHTVRAELTEVQKADLGRKYARVDRRPLDPPPAVLLRLFYVYNHGTTYQTEKEIENYDEVENLGLLCNVDLFPVPSSEIMKDSDRQDGSPSTSSQVTYPVPVSPHSNSSYSQPNYPSSSTNHPPQPLQYPESQEVAGQSSAAHLPRRTYASFVQYHSNSEVVAHFGGYPITESMKCTNALVGATFVQPANVDYRGKKSLMFVFADLAVKIEGTFILRYRSFDIFSKTYENNDLAVQAECYGGPFRVYSTKEFPGLHASTDLTKQLAKWGVRLNIRETERRRRRKGDRRSASPVSSSSKGKERENESNGESPPSDDE